MTQWQEVEPFGPQQAGDIGGDEQLSEAWSRRFVLPADDDGVHPVMTISFYVATESINDANSVRLMRRCIEYMLCKDPDNPGDTEVWCDYSYVRVPFEGELTEKAAREMCERLPVPTATTWNGNLWHRAVDSPWWRAGERP